MSVVKALKAAHRSWSDYWFAGVDARSAGVMRLTLGVLLVWGHLALWPELEQIIGPAALIAPDSVAKEFNEHRLGLYDLAKTVPQLSESWY